MVYTGKPSRACATCKKRRIKCDEGRPACGQCLKSKRECTGYRTEAELMFRDETRATAQRAARKVGRPTSAPANSTPKESQSLVAFNDLTLDFDSDEPVRALIQGNPQYDETMRTSNPLWYQDQAYPSPNPALSMSLHEQANAFFFNHFTLFGTEHFFHMYDMLQEQYRKADIDDPIRATTDAVSIITFSRQRGHEAARPEASRKYAIAVRQVARAIADPTRLREDGTLLSVVMLGFAETMDVTTALHPGFVPRFTQKPEEAGITKFHHAWGAHANGAEIIVKARGLDDMMRSRNSMHLAAFVRFQTIHRAIFTAQPLDSIDTLWSPLSDLKDTTSAYYSHIILSGIALQIPSLRHRGLLACRKPMHPGLGATLTSLLTEVRAVDAQLSAWTTTVWASNAIHIAGYYIEPPSSSPHHERTWPGAVFHYDALMVMNGLNLCRVYRLFTNMLVFNILERLIPPEQLKTHPEFIECRTTIAAVVDDICASVPYGMGYLHELPLSPMPMQSPVGTFVTPELKADFVQTFHANEQTGAAAAAAAQSGSGSSRARSRVDEGAGPAIGAWYQVWPLYVAYCMVLITDAQKGWIRGRLKYIGETFGIAQAIMYQMSYKETYQPFKTRRFMPLDFAPPPWVPVE